MSYPYALGCDISRWQDDNSTAQRVDFAKMRTNGASFVFIKASQYNWADEDFIINWANAKTAGLLRGAYHFLTWEDPIVQAEFFAGVLKRDPGELPPVCDFEWWKTTPSDAVTRLKRFCERLSILTGKVPAIYTAPSFFDPLVADTDVYWLRYPLWVASWGANSGTIPPAKPYLPKPYLTWEFWQWSSKGDGLAFGCESKQVDLNFFNGSEADLRAKYAPGVVIPDPEPEPPADDRLDEILDLSRKIWARVDANLEA